MTGYTCMHGATGCPLCTWDAGLEEDDDPGTWGKCGVCGDDGWASICPICWEEERPGEPYPHGGEPPL